MKLMVILICLLLQFAACGSNVSSDPIGIIKVWPNSNKIPDNYLPCDGRPLMMQNYPDLYKVIGHKFGGSGAVFFLPAMNVFTINGHADVYNSSIGRFEGHSRSPLYVSATSDTVGSEDSINGIVQPNLSEIDRVFKASFFPSNPGKNVKSFTTFGLVPTSFEFKTYKAKWPLDYYKCVTTSFTILKKSSSSGSSNDFDRSPIITYIIKYK